MEKNQARYDYGYNGVIYMCSHLKLKWNGLSGPKQQINQKQDLNTSSLIMGTNPSTLLSKAGTGSLCRDVCHTLWGACKSVHCCMCLEHNKGRHSPLGAMNRTRSFSFYPWCPARVCLDRAAMLSVWKLGSCCEPGLKSVTIRILHLWVTLGSETDFSSAAVLAYCAFIFWRYES